MLNLKARVHGSSFQVESGKAKRRNSDSLKELELTHINSISDKDKGGHGVLVLT